MIRLLYNVLIIPMVFGMDNFIIGLNFQVPVMAYDYAITRVKYTKQNSQELKANTSINIYLDQSPFGYSAPRFDLLMIPQGPSQNSTLQCYVNNTNALRNSDVCYTLCPSYLESNSFNQSLNQYQGEVDTSMIYIIDNTGLPCMGGTFFEKVEPWIVIQTLFSVDKKYFQIVPIMTICIIICTAIQIITITVLYYKLRKLKKKVRLREQGQQNPKYSKKLFKNPFFFNSGVSQPQTNTRQERVTSKLSSLTSDKQQYTIN